MQLFRMAAAAAGKARLQGWHRCVPSVTRCRPLIEACSTWSICPQDTEADCLPPNNSAC
jgi:hypothetical protein